MSEILSQDEIDAILSALSSPESQEEKPSKSEDQRKKIRVYDFKRPNKFSKEQIHTIQAIHENYARLLSTFLSAHLRTVVQTTVHSVEQLTYDEFVHSLANPTIMNVFQLEPLAGNAILDINPVIGFSIVDRLFGGPGQPIEKIRELTDIERVVIEKVVNRMLDILIEAWDNIVQFKPKLDAIEMNPFFTQIVSPTEMVVLISFKTKLGETEGFLNLCFPFIVLEPIINKLSAHFWFAGTGREVTKDGFDKIKKRIEKANVSLSAILGKANITIRELLELQKGDVIILDSKVDKTIDVLVGSRKKFLGRPGTLGSKVGVQIVSVLKEGDDDNE